MRDPPGSGTSSTLGRYPLCKPVPSRGISAGFGSMAGFGGINRRERENLAAGMGRRAQGIKSMLMAYMHTHSHSKLVLFCFLDISSSHSRKVASLYFLATGALV